MSRNLDSESIRSRCSSASGAVPRFAGLPISIAPRLGPGLPGEGRGKWVNVTQNPATGAITVGSPYTKRTPWYNQTDFNFTQNYKIGETKVVSFSAIFTNLLNSRSVTQVEGNISSGFSANYVDPGGSFPTGSAGLVGGTSAGTPFYAATFHPYDFAALMNAAPTSSLCTAPNGPPNTVALPNTCGPLTVNSGYGLPNRYQASRSIRLGLRFTF